MASVGDIFELALRSRDSTSGVGMINVFHFRQKAGFLSAINLVGEWRLQLEAEWRVLVSTTQILEGYSCRTLIPHNVDSYDVTVSLPGTYGPNPLPPNVCAVITWRTGFPGRRKRGRTYIGGVDRFAHNGGQLIAAYRDVTLTAFGNKLVSVFGAGGSSPTTEVGVWSRLNAGPDPPFNPAGFQAITSFTPQIPLCTMGTRKWGRGY